MNHCSLSDLKSPAEKSHMKPDAACIFPMPDTLTARLEERLPQQFFLIFGVAAIKSAPS